MAKRNVGFIKPEDPPFLKALKRQAGYDDTNHKFDELENAEEDFVNDGDDEQPQVVVLKSGDLTAEEAEVEKTRLEKEESETKADLTQKVIFQSKKISTSENNSSDPKKRKSAPDKKNIQEKKSKPLLSFNEDEDDEIDSS